VRCAASSVDEPRQQEGATQAVGGARSGRLHVVAQRRQLLVDLFDAVAPLAGLHLVEREHHAQGEQVTHQAGVAVFLRFGAHGVVACCCVSMLKASHDPV